MRQVCVRNGTREGMRRIRPIWSPWASRTTWCSSPVASSRRFSRCSSTWVASSSRNARRLMCEAVFGSKYTQGKRGARSLSSAGTRTASSPWSLCRSSRALAWSLVEISNSRIVHQSTNGAGSGSAGFRLPNAMAATVATRRDGESGGVEVSEWRGTTTPLSARLGRPVASGGVFIEGADLGRRSC